MNINAEIIFPGQRRKGCYWNEDLRTAVIMPDYTDLTLSLAYGTRVRIMGKWYEISDVQKRSDALLELIFRSAG